MRSEKKNPAEDINGDEYLTNIAYDSVVFGFSADKLKILLIEYHNTAFFALPGGFVRKDENLNDAVRRGLKERTGLSDVYLEQSYTFGDTGRHKPQVLKTILEGNGYLPGKSHWLLDRFITISYYALINYKKAVLKPDTLSDSCAWYNIDELPQLILDHKDIVAKALQALRSNLDQKLVGMNLLPPSFTMKNLQQAYESIAGEKTRRTTFQRKILNLDILERLEKQYSGKAHKAPYLYRFKK